MRKIPYIPSKIEERFNVYTHLPGVFLGLIGMIFLILKSSHDFEVTTSYIVYSLTFSLIFGASALYHLKPYEDISKAKLKKVDHACIYIFIAGTYTPFILKNMLPQYRSYFLVFVWTVAIVGVLYKLINRYQNTLLSLSLYFSFGLMCFLAKDSLLEQIPEMSFNFLVLGGLCYSVGVIFYVWNKIPFNHAIWHIFVLMGACSHYVAVYNA